MTRSIQRHFDLPTLQLKALLNPRRIQKKTFSHTTGSHAKAIMKANHAARPLMSTPQITKYYSTKELKTANKKRD